MALKRRRGGGEVFPPYLILICRLNISVLSGGVVNWYILGSYLKGRLTTTKGRTVEQVERDIRSHPLQTTNPLIERRLSESPNCGWKVVVTVLGQGIHILILLMSRIWHSGSRCNFCHSQYLSYSRLIVGLPMHGYDITFLLFWEIYSIPAIFYRQLFKIQKSCVIR